MRSVLRLRSLVFRAPLSTRNRPVQAIIRAAAAMQILPKSLPEQLL